MIHSADGDVSVALVVYVKRRDGQANVVDVGKLVLERGGVIRPVPAHQDQRDVEALQSLLDEGVRLPPRYETILPAPHPERFKLFLEEGCSGA